MLGACNFDRIAYGEAMNTEAESLLFDLLHIPGLSGQERQVADFIRARLLEAGCPEDALFEDDAHTRIPGNFEMGNLIVKLPGTRPGPRVMLSGHMDTVPLVQGVKPQLEGRRIVSDGTTALGADNRTACAAILYCACRILKEGLDHPPMTLLFTVGEEIGLFGAKEVSFEDLGKPELGINIDSGDPAKAVIGAIGAHRWTVEVLGKSAHAGVHPEHGASSILMASRAIADISAKGYFGKIELNGRKGTSNVGVIEGGDATNQVCELIRIKGESRSHDAEFLREITDTICAAFEQAAASVSSVDGFTGSVKFQSSEDYHSFRMEEDAPVVRVCREAMAALELELVTEITDGGLDANFLNLKGVPTVTLGAGQHNPHTQQEYADLDEFSCCCDVLAEILKRV